MKKLNFLALTMLFTTLCLTFYANAQNRIYFEANNVGFTTDNSNPKIVFEKLVHDYGTITEGDNGDIEFSFTNTGKEPLILSKVHGCCGVSVLNWTKDPVMPNGTGSIKLKYYTSRIGVINKTITVNTNDPENEVVHLKLKGEVQRKMFE